MLTMQARWGELEYMENVSPLWVPRGSAGIGAPLACRLGCDDAEAHHVRRLWHRSQTLWLQMRIPPLTRSVILRKLLFWVCRGQ